MIVVTGGAGFIGSALVHELNRRGITDILVVDHTRHPEKAANLAALEYRELWDKAALLDRVLKQDLPRLDAILHMGACSSTTETDEDYLHRNNYEYTRHLAQYALEKDIRFIYASSAATYGDGSQGYSDDEGQLDSLRPLNLYGKSKQQFDLWARAEGVLDRLVGLKYFNVYGPNEYHKGDMQSLVRKGYFQVRDTGRLRLFRSHRPEYKDGEQERDFVYIRDAVAMTLFFLDHPEVGGLYNIGAGAARTWNDLAGAIFRALGREANIEYIDMPESIREQYQYHTCAPLDKLRRAGYDRPVTPLEDGIADYVSNYLVPGKHLGE